MPFTPRLIFVTAPSIEMARHVAEQILERKLAACVNLVPGLESHYWWEGKLEKAAEVQLIIKSSAEHFEMLSEIIQLHHPYDCPEIIAIAPEEMSPAYRAWWEHELQIEDSD